MQERARAAADRVRLSEQLDEMRQLLLMHASADRGGAQGMPDRLVRTRPDIAKTWLAAASVQREERDWGAAEIVAEEVKQSWLRRR